MMGLILAAAAQGPVLLASADEARWQSFIRASLEGPPATAPRAGGSRIRQLESVVRALRQEDAARRVAGPSGL